MSGASGSSRVAACAGSELNDTVETEWIDGQHLARDFVANDESYDLRDRDRCHAARFLARPPRQRYRLAAQRDPSGRSHRHPSPENLSPVTTFSDQQQSYLDQFGFDPVRFSAFQDGLKAGKFSYEANTVQSPLVAPPADAVRELPPDGSPERDELRKLGEEAIGRGELGIVILNGGMATRFGGAVKGCVDVLDGRSFLDLKISDTTRTAKACNGKIPVFLMNSFATDAKTKTHLEEKNWFGLSGDDIRCYTQFISVRMTPNGELYTKADGELSYHGPGHGDFAPAIRASGCLRKFREEGGKHLLVANVDNLGARVSPTILGFHISRKAQATVEVAPKWEGDVGGSPFHRGRQAAADRADPLPRGIPAR